jgi:hypothetical protein
METPALDIQECGLADGPTVASIRSTVDEHFPRLWPAVDVGLATCATLFLADNTNPVALIYEGPPSSSKTTVADMFAGHSLCYRSDNFTPAAFVSHATNQRREDLAKVDLLPRIRHKVLVTPELATVFRGKEDDLVNQFKIITRVLDGQGLLTDSGAQGRRGYEGDYLFAWLGCTTPFDAKVWRVMAQLGSRLFFLVMDTEVEVTEDDLLAATEGLPYGDRLKASRKSVHEFLTALQEDCGGVRGVPWDSHADPEPVSRWIARLARLLVAIRSEPTRESDPSIDGPGFIPGKPETPYRAHAVLRNLARGHALVHGRRQLAADDLPTVARVVASSIPTKLRPVFAALVRSSGDPLTVAQVQAALNVKHPETARRVMEDFATRGVAEYVEAGQGKAAIIRFRPEWGWCYSAEFQTMPEPVTGEGLCVA